MKIDIFLSKYGNIACFLFRFDKFCFGYTAYMPISSIYRLISLSNFNFIFLLEFYLKSSYTQTALLCVPIVKTRFN